MSTTQKLKAKSLRELYDIVSRPANVFKDKTSGLTGAMVKTDTSVITITDPSSGKDVSVVKASVYSFNDNSCILLKAILYVTSNFSANIVA